MINSIVVKPFWIPDILTVQYNPLLFPTEGMLRCRILTNNPSVLCYQVAVAQ
jgi:hypothetical protein